MKESIRERIEIAARERADGVRRRPNRQRGFPAGSTEPKPEALSDEVERLRKDLAMVVEYMRAVELWARYHDHGIRMRTIEMLRKIGEWPE